MHVRTKTKAKTEHMTLVKEFVGIDNKLGTTVRYRSLTKPYDQLRSLFREPTTLLSNDFESAVSWAAYRAGARGRVGWAAYPVGAR